MRIDFLRFAPEKEFLKSLGFENAVVFVEEMENDGDYIRGEIIRPESADELRKKLRKVSKKSVVGVESSSISINREAVTRRRVDVILDFPGRRIDYVTVKLAAEKDVVIEICLSKFLLTRGARRMRLLRETEDLFRIIKKFDTPFVITSGASNIYEMRSVRQLREFFSFLGAEVEKAERQAAILFRKYADANFIMNGLEIEERP